MTRPALYDDGCWERTQDEQAAVLGRLLLEQHQEDLQDGVGEARADGHVLQQPLQVVQHDDGHRRLRTTHTAAQAREPALQGRIL